MVAPQHFFSTLAQASAGIVGFVTAVAAALYSLERQRVEQRTDNYREALTEFENRYGFALLTLESMLEGEGGTTTHEMTDDLSLDNDEIEELVREEYDKKPATSLYLAHVRRILGLFHRIGPEKDYVLTTDELESLQQSVSWMYIQFYNVGDEPNSVIKELIKEATGKHYSEHEESADIKLFSDSNSITGFHPFQLQQWFKERRAVESEVLRPTPDNAEFRDEYLTGDNFWTIKTLSEFLYNDLQDVRRKSVGTVVRYDSGIRPVMKVSTYLILVGVVLPTVFLFSSPVTLPMWLILMSQIVLLAGTVMLALTLVEFVLRSAEPTSQIRDTDNLSRFSSTVVSVLPDLPV